MDAFSQELEQRLQGLRDKSLHRGLRRIDSPQGPRVRIDGIEYLNFSSNDYLGLANHPRLKEAAAAALGQFGAGSGASRLICGSLAPHHRLEESLAAFKQTEAALAFSSGYACALGTIGALVSTDDVVVIDRRVHASIVDAARLSRAKLRVFAHNDLDDLEQILRWADQRASAASFSSSGKKPRTLIVTESVFSMDGDHAPLADLVALKERHGAWLMVDEAHATGLYGAGRRGLIEEMGVAGRVEIQMGTLGKAIGAAGGYICGSSQLRDYLVNQARSFIFSTAPIPAAAAAAREGVEWIQAKEGEHALRRLRALAGELHAALAPFESFAGNNPRWSAILPLMIGGENPALDTAATLLRHGVYVPAIRHPTVARGAARLRFTITAAHSPGDIQQLSEALASLRTDSTPH